MLIILVLTVLTILGASKARSPDIVRIPGGISGIGTTTRYWDCCKPTCAWRESFPTTFTNLPVRSCTTDGETTISPSVQSGCDRAQNGTSYACSDQVGFVINSTLAYGFAGVSLTGGLDTTTCCTCMLLTFQDQIPNKSMVVQITNSGSDLGVNQFDIAIPGGGLGLFHQGCLTQWPPIPEDRWSVTSQNQCSYLPESLQDGCNFRFGFMEGASNPAVSFSQVECPAELVEISECQL